MLTPNNTWMWFLLLLPLWAGPSAAQKPDADASSATTPAVASGASAPSAPAVLPASDRAQVSHLLEFSPANALLLRGREVPLRIEAQNVDTVTVRGRWIDGADAALCWSDPEWTPDGEEWFFEEDWVPNRSGETQTRRIRLPAERGAALWLEADSDSVSTRTALQWSSVSATTFLGARHGLAWITSLEEGAPISGAAVALVSVSEITAEDESKRLQYDTVWEGRSDAEGLVWFPGTSVFPETNAPELLKVSVDGRDSWFPLGASDPRSTPRLERNPEPSADHRAMLWTDRMTYSAQDEAHWAVWLVTRTDRELVAAADTLQLWVNGGGATQKHEVRVDARGRAQGRIPLPSSPGPVEIELRHPETGASLTRRTIEVRHDSPPRLRLQAVNGAARVVGSERIDLTCQTFDPLGGPLSGIPVEWRIARDEREDWSPEGPYAHFEFTPERRPSTNDSIERTEASIDASEKTDREGWATARWQREIENEVGCRRVRVIAQGPSDFAEAEAEFEFLWFRSPFQVGLHDLSDEPGYRGSLAWEWVVVDTDGRTVSDVAITAELLEENENGEPRSVWTRELVSGSDRQVVAVERPGPGSYSLRLRQDGDPVGVSLAAGSNPQDEALPARVPFSIRPGNGDNLEILMPGTPASGAHTLFVVEQDEVMAARSVFVPGSGTIGLPLPPLPPPKAKLRATQIGSAPPSDTERGRSPALFEGSVQVKTDDPRLRCRIDLDIQEVADSLDLALRLFDSNGRPAAGQVSVAVTGLPVSQGDSASNSGSMDPVAALFAKSGAAPKVHEPRRRLPQTRTRANRAEVSSDPVSNLTAGRQTAASADETLTFVRTNLQMKPDMPLQLRVPTPSGSHPRVQVLAQTDGLGMALVDTVVMPTGIRFVLPSPTALRRGDEIELPLLVENASSNEFDGHLQIETEGGRCRKDKLDLKVAKQSSEWLVLPLHDLDAPSLEITLQAVEETGGIVRKETHTILVAEEVRRERSTRSGTAAPRASEEIELNDPWILSGERVHLDIAGSYFIKLRDALVSVLHNDLPGVGAEIARLEAATLILNRRDWFDRALDVEDQALGALDRLRAAGIPRSLGAPIRPARMASGTSGWAERFYHDAWALRAAKQADEAGIEVDPTWVGQLEDAVRGFHDATSSSQSRPALDLAALLYWVRAETDGLSLDEPLFSWFLSRDDRFGRHGRLWSSLALSAWSEDSLSTPLANSVAARIHTMVEEIDEDIPADWTEGLWRDSVDLTADALLLLARSRPNHRLVPVFLRGLLQSREADSSWSNPRQAMSACTALDRVLRVLEDPTRTPGGQFVWGVSSPTRFIFEEGSPVAEFAWTTEELARIRRKNPDSTRLKLALETRRLGRAHYRLWTESRESALEMKASNAGVGLERIYRDRIDGDDGKAKTERQRVSHRWVEVEVRLTLSEDVDGLIVEDPLPPHTQVWPTDTNEIRNAFEVREHSVRWRTGPLSAGLHSFSYHIMVPGDGRFRVPGTKARLSDLSGKISHGSATELTVSSD